MKNWFNQEIHPSDNIISWTDKNPKQTSKKVREAYDLISKVSPDVSKALKFLLDQAFEAGQQDEKDFNHHF